MRFAFGAIAVLALVQSFAFASSSLALSYPKAWNKKARHSALTRRAPSLPSGWSVKGCFTDSISARTLGGYSSSTAKNTPQACLSSCQTGGYLYGGVEYGQECYCSNTMVVNSSTGQSASSGDCSMPCSGDSTQTCGAAVRIMIYTFASTLPTLPSGWSVQGCYSDSVSARTLVGYSSSTTTNTPQSCLNTCHGQGYVYGGVEYAQECYCSNTMLVSSSTGQQESPGDCSMPCSGDSTQTCGGGDRIMIYAYGSTTVLTSSPPGSSSPPSGWNVKGCFSDSVSARTLVGYSSSTLTNTPQSCLNTCQTRGYAYGGVEYGAECYCSNTMVVGSSTGQSTSTGDCSMPCSGDPTQTCGAGDRIMIYTSESPLPSGWSALGCYTDAVSNRALASFFNSSSTNTPSSCIANCVSLGYSFAGVEYGQECFCADSITATPSAFSGQVASYSDCSMGCSGSPAQTCGNSNRIFIYNSSSTTPTRTTPTAPPASGKVVVAHFMVGNAYSYIQSTWSTNIAAAMSGGIDGFALNVGDDSWAPSRVSDAYAAATGTSFKLFLSFDMTSLPCASPGDATLLQQYISTYATHPNQLYYQGKLVVSSFSGADCTFGQGDVNSGWNHAIKARAPQPIAFIPSFFSPTSSFASTPVMDGAFNWNGGWPMGDYDINFSSDQTYINSIGGRYYIAPVSPVFFTHYGVNTYNKNWIYRSDDWLYNTRWELLIENRAQIDIVQIITWNDYGESHYIGPIGADQPNSQAWANGFDHQGWNVMTKYYADAWRTGVYPTITKNQIFLSSRPHSRDLTINDPIGKPNSWQWTDDCLYAVVFATGPGSLQLSIGSSSSTTGINAGVNKIKLALSPGSPTAVLLDSGGNTILTFSPSGFTYVTDPPAYNFNYYMAASP